MMRKRLQESMEQKKKKKDKGRRQKLSTIQQQGRLQAAETKRKRAGRGYSVLNVSKSSRRLQLHRCREWRLREATDN